MKKKIKVIKEALYMLFHFHYLEYIGRGQNYSVRRYKCKICGEHVISKYDL